MTLQKDVGNRIRELRKAKGWAQEQLTEAASLHYSYIGGVERRDRNISLETLEKIIATFQVPAVEKSTYSFYIGNIIISYAFLNISGVTFLIV